MSVCQGVSTGMSMLYLSLPACHGEAAFSGEVGCGPEPRGYVVVAGRDITLLP